MKNPNTKKHTRPLHAPSAITTPASITSRAINALLPFGLIPNHSKAPTHRRPINSQLLNQISNAHLTLITGPSGSGKSTLLNQLINSLPNTIAPTNLPPIDSSSINCSKPIVNLFNTPLNQTLQLLSQTGLAQPNLWALPATALSTGEQARLQIAHLLDAALQSNQPTTIILDELATPLDRLTARSLCALINKLIEHNHSSPNRIRIIAAAAHEDLPTYLNTKLLINATDHSILPNQYHKEHITYEQGNATNFINDYLALKPHHYLGSDPKSIARIDRALRTCPITGNQVLAGVLVVNYPTLNASWRDRAWPGRYTTDSKSNNAKRINKELRRIARVIIAPHSRSLGIASTLVRNYLASPLTPATEALAAMGSTNPFFKAAGMTEYPIPHTPTDLRLLDCLHHLNLIPNDLIQTNRLIQTKNAKPTSSPVLTGEVSASSQTEGVFSYKQTLHPLLQRELQTWARTKRLDPTNPNLPAYAAFKLLTQPRAYAHVNNTKEQRA